MAGRGLAPRAGPVILPQFPDAPRRRGPVRKKDLPVSLIIGLDTGGTYTDGVVYDPNAGVLATGKSLTTKHDLSLGLGFNSG